MNLFKYFIQILGLIFVIVVASLLINLNYLSRLSEHHGKIHDEWEELQNIVNFQTKLNEIITYLSFHQIVQAPSQEAILKRINLAEKHILLLKNYSVKEDTAEYLSTHPHANTEFIKLNKLIKAFNDFSYNLKASIASHSKPNLDSINQNLSLLLNIQSIAFDLQYVYVDEMQSVLSIAEYARSSIIYQAFIFSGIIIIILIATSIFAFIHLSKRTTILIEQQKLLTIGALTQSLIHEIRNPLGIIKSSASILKKNTDSKKINYELIDYMIEEVDRIDDILNHLLSLKNENTIPFSDQIISDIIKKSIVLLEGKLNTCKVSIKFINNTEKTKVYCNPNLIQQAVLNLLINAIQASSPNSVITIETGIEHHFFNLTINDSGKGMSEEELTKIFDAFYTTKNKGMGLGLLIVKGIIDKHNGQINVQSIAQKGTEVKIRLPYDKTQEH